MQTPINLDSTLAMAVMPIANSLMPQGWQATHNAPSTLEACTKAFQQSGQITVSDWHGVGSIFSTPWTQIAFQAWHDYHHVMLQAAFDSAGERIVHGAMLSDLTAWYQNNRDKVTQHQFNRAACILLAHNVGRLEYWREYSDSPYDFAMFAAGVLYAMGEINK